MEKTQMLLLNKIKELISNKNLPAELYDVKGAESLRPDYSIVILVVSQLDDDSDIFYLKELENKEK